MPVPSPHHRHHDLRYDYKRALADEHMADVRAEVGERRQALLVRCCSGAARLACEVRSRLGRNRKPC